MTTLTLLKSYLGLNVGLGIASILIWVCVRARGQLVRPVRFQHLLAASYLLVTITSVLPVITAVVSPQQQTTPTAQIWSALKASDLSPRRPIQPAARAGLSLGKEFVPVPLGHAGAAFLLLIALGAVIVTARLWRDYGRLSNILRQATLVKRIGAVTLLATDQPIVPFSMWRPRRAFVVVPVHFFSNPQSLSFVVRHELQHHRQHDTQWIYVLQALKAFCFWNPFVSLLQHEISNLAELACDEALTGHHGISSTAYCDCLLWVAQQSLPDRVHLAGTAGFARSTAAKLLRWRIEEMFKEKSRYMSKGRVAAISMLAATAIGAAVALAQGGIHDRRVTLEEARKWATAVRSESFPIVVNELVLAELNRYLGTPDGREFVRKSLAQMPNYQAAITAELDRYGLPHELLAVPFVESGYRNLPQGDGHEPSAGLWQFIASTARNFGLRVDDSVDERLDIGLETNAGARLLGALNLQFQDWGLALLGYNGGDNLVTRGIRETQSRDVWELIRKGYEGDRGYVARVVAAVLIINNPSVLD